MYIINVVHMQGLKLTYRLQPSVVMISLAVRLMTSQGLMHVQCVINGLQRKTI